MKIVKKLSIVMCIVFMVVATFKSLAQTKPNFTIHGAIKGMVPFPAKVYLIYPSYLKLTDSAVVTNSTYTISGHIDNVAGADLSLSAKVSDQKPETHAALVLDKGDFDVISTGSFNNITVAGTGASAHAEFEAIMKTNREEIAEISKVMKTDQYKNDPEFKKTISLQYYKLFSKNSQTLIVYARANPRSIVSPYITYILMSSGFVTPAMRDTLMWNVLPSIMQTPLGHAIRSLVDDQKAKANKAAADAEARRKEYEEKISLRTKAIGFTMNDTEGNPVSLSSFKGQFVLIDFWASWCVPCRAENLNMVKTYAIYKDKGFTILGVSLDTEAQKAAWFAAIKKDGLVWKQVGDLKGWRNEAARLYKVESIPQNFLIDPNGVIIAKNLSGGELNKKLEEILGK